MQKDWNLLWNLQEQMVCYDAMPSRQWIIYQECHQVEADKEEEVESEIDSRMAQTLTSLVIENWKKKRPKFSHDYAHVGRLLFQNPSINLL